MKTTEISSTTANSSSAIYFWAFKNFKGKQFVLHHNINDEKSSCYDNDNWTDMSEKKLKILRHFSYKV